jgi:hypothetical protein
MHYLVIFRVTSLNVMSRATMRAGGLGGTRRERTAISAKAFFRFIGWFPTKPLTRAVGLQQE